MGKMARIKERGQMTIPVELRRELGWGDGDVIAVHREGGRLILERPEDIIEELFGGLHAYADPANRYRDIQSIVEEERESFELGVAEEVAEELHET